MCNPCRKSDRHAEGYAVGEEDSRESVGGRLEEEEVGVGWRQWWCPEAGGDRVLEGVGGGNRGWGDSGGRRWWWPEAGEDRVERAEGKC